MSRHRFRTPGMEPHFRLETLEAVREIEGYLSSLTVFRVPGRPGPKEIAIFQGRFWAGIVSKGQVELIERAFELFLERFRSVVEDLLGNRLQREAASHGLSFTMIPEWWGDGQEYCHFSWNEFYWGYRLFFLKFVLALRAESVESRILRYLHED